MNRDWESLELTDILPVGVCSILADLTISFWNRRLEEWTGLHREVMIGKPISEQFPHLGLPRYTTRIQQVFSDRLPVFLSPQIHPHIIPVHCGDGSLRYQRTSIVPVIRENRVTSALIVIEDITEAVHQVFSYRAMRDRALADLAERRRAEAVAREANRKLGLLNSITRHDIKNQLTAILAYGELMAEEVPDPSHKRFIDSMLQAARTIDRQIGYTKEYQEIGAHEPAWIRVDMVIRRSSRVVQDHAISVISEVGGIEVYADPLVEKIFSNFMENTLIHGKKATRIIFSVEPAEKGISILCEDNGVGIPDQEKSRIFSRGYGPSPGFGLSLAREILSLTGMEILEDGVLGEGARFRITVPEGVYRYNPPDTPAGGSPH